MMMMIIKKYLTNNKKYVIIIIENKEREVFKMKNYVYHNDDVRKALVKVGYKPTPKKSRKNKKNA